MFVGDGMSTVCCLTIPSNHYSLLSPSLLTKSIDTKDEQHKRTQAEEENYSIIANQHLSPMRYSNTLSTSNRVLHQQHPQQLLLVAEEAEVLDVDNQTDNDKLLLPRSTRSLKRRPSLFEKSRDWVRLIYIYLI